MNRVSLALLSSLVIAAGCAGTSGKTMTAAASSSNAVIWKNATGRKIDVHTVDTFDAACPPMNPGGTSNFTLQPGDEHSLKLVEGQVFCWTWRFDDDSSTDKVNFCTANAGDVIDIDAARPPATGCKEVIRQ